MPNHTTNNQGYRIFCSQLHSVLEKYPNLKECMFGSEKGLKGILDIPDDKGRIIGSFLIVIRFSNNFPYQFPILYEVGGDIPNNPNWHKYEDESCCITVAPDEILKCKQGLSALKFIESYAIPYFANQIYRRETSLYKNGDYAHGLQGIFQFYEENLGNNIAQWINCYDFAFTKPTNSMNRNSICFCGSQQKYKRCHLQAVDFLKLIGQEQVCHDFNILFRQP
jgi:hypothetical protein